MFDFLPTSCLHLQSKVFDHSTLIENVCSEHSSRYFYRIFCKDALRYGTLGSETSWVDLSEGSQVEMNAEIELSLSCPSLGDAWLCQDGDSRSTLLVSVVCR